MEKEYEGVRHVLKIDVDPGHEVFSVEHMNNLLARAGYKMKMRMKARSISGKGWHVWVFLDRAPETDMEIVALQAILGSDRYREACNVQRARTITSLSPEMREYWGTRWNVFYAGKEPKRGQDEDPETHQQAGEGGRAGDGTRTKQRVHPRQQDAGVQRGEVHGR